MPANAPTLKALFAQKSWGVRLQNHGNTARESCLAARRSSPLWGTRCLTRDSLPPAESRHTSCTEWLRYRAKHKIGGRANKNSSGSKGSGFGCKLWPFGFRDDQTSKSPGHRSNSPQSWPKPGAARPTGCRKRLVHMPGVRMSAELRQNRTSSLATHPELHRANKCRDREGPRSQRAPPSCRRGPSASTAALYVGSSGCSEASGSAMPAAGRSAERPPARAPTRRHARGPAHERDPGPGEAARDRHGCGPGMSPTRPLRTRLCCRALTRARSTQGCPDCPRASPDPMARCPPEHQQQPQWRST